MNYLDDDILKKGISEMFRVSKRWIMHCEKYEKTEKQIDENHKFRNMGEKWLDYKVKLVSDVDLHEDYGLDQTRFTLLKKLLITLKKTWKIKSYIAQNLLKYFLYKNLSYRFQMIEIAKIYMLHPFQPL